VCFDDLHWQCELDAEMVRAFTLAYSQCPNDLRCVLLPLFK
jgi:hypothetical protein